jgi:hypothetical protein
MAAASYTIAPSAGPSVTSVIRSVRTTHRHDVTESRKSSKPRRSRGRRKPRPPRAAAPPAAPPPTVEAAPPPPEPQPEPAPVEIEFANPEYAFAARAAARPPEPERPFPTSRRAIFFDVENTSRPQHIARVIDYLSVDRLGRRTDFVAVGNWRVIGHDTARLLAGHGAQLLHSAPSVGVKDWSDLRIAVAAGVWLGTARPGDILEILSDDRAFDAVGDVATGLGISFRRLSYRGLTGLPREAEPAAAEPRAEPSSSGGRHRRGRRGGYGGRREMPIARVAPQPAARQVAAAEPHTAPHDELLGVARDLIRVAPGGAVTLDTLANALKGRGFSRTPGSPRLITRLRRIRELTVSRSGHITLIDPHAAAPTPMEAEPLEAESAEIEPIDVEPVARVAPEPAPRPSSRDVRSLDERRAEVEAAQRLHAAGSPAPAPAPALAPAPAPAPPSEGSQEDGFRRRRSRRGGRRHRRHSTPAAG